MSLLRHSLLINTPFTNEDKLSIKLLYQEKGWGAKLICKEFSNKKWAVSSVRDLLCMIDTTNLISPKAGSGRPRTIRMEQNIEHVAEPICSQEDNPGSSKSPIDIEKFTGISCSSVQWITKTDLQCSFMSSDARMRTCCLILIVDQWRPRLKAVVQVHGGHIEPLFTRLSGCCMLLLLWYSHKHALLLFCHCDIMMFGCFDSVLIVLNNLLTY